MSAQPQVLIDASNLRTGGAVQVASSFVDEVQVLAARADFRSRYPWLGETQIEVSSIVESNRANTAAPATVSVQPMDSRWWSPSAWQRGRRPCVEFVLFGPRYGRRAGRRQIMGFADGLLVNPQPATRERRPVVRRVRSWLRARVARRIFCSADLLVVETEHVRSLVTRSFGIEADKVVVVPNVVNAVFTTNSPAPVLPNPPQRCEGVDRYLCYVSRAYPHKNLEFLPRLAAETRRRHDLQLGFFVTLTEDEWAACSPELRRVSVNAGPLPIHRVPALYRLSDAAIFPSLLESSSVTPLEAMHVGLPLFASDRDFVRSACADYPIYFDPQDPSAAAAVIAAALRDPERLARHVTAGQDLVAQQPTAAARAERYLALIDEQLTSLTGPGASTD